MHIARCALVLLCAASSACAPAPKMADLAGTYVLSIETDTLHLESSGRYRRVFCCAGVSARPAVDTGRWRLSNDSRRIALAALPQRWPEHGRYDSVSREWHQPDTLLRGFVSLRILRGWGGRFSLDAVPELGWRYRRVADTAAASGLVGVSLGVGMAGEDSG